MGLSVGLMSSVTGDGTGTALPPFDPSAEREAPASSPARKRRAYQVWERDPNAPADAVYCWGIAAAAVEAPSRPGARKQATDGRPGTFATVLVGEWVEETVEDAETLLAEHLATAIQARFSDRLSMDEVRSVAREAVSAAGARTDV